MIKVMQPTGERWRLGHRPALDGVRGIAIALVLASHAWAAAGSAGGVGVTMFFALSGFLITTLLLEELDDTGRISLRAFYVRRARRLLPALAAFLGVLVLLSLGLWFPLVTAQNVAAVATYSTNWVMIAQDAGMPRLNHLWSLAVEEQFYLLWPLLVIATARFGGRRALTALCVVGAVYAIVMRIVLWEAGASAARIYYATDLRADSLLVGCLLAIVMHRSRERRSLPVLAGVALLPLVPLLAVQGGARWLIAPAVTPFAAAVLIWCVAQGPGVGWLQQRWLVLLGRRSYAVYLWHSLFMVTLAPLLPLHHWVTVAVGLVATWGAALVSWRFVEEPFLRNTSLKVKGISGCSDQSDGGESAVSSNASSHAVPT